MATNPLAAPIDVGEADQEVVFETESTIDDGHGGQILSWVVLGGAWAKIAPLSASEKERQGRAITSALYRIWIMTEAAAEMNLNTTHRMLWADLVFNVREASKVPPRHAWTGIIVEASGK